MYYLFLLIICKVAIVFTQESWVVNTEYGAVRGFWDEQYSVWSFRGMPYAAAPVGQGRYKAPVPPIPWSGILNATADSIMCVQESGGIEDCLIVNVFVPQSAKTAGPLPVLFFTHGGGFNYGNSNTYNPYLTTRHDVVLVTINYRVNTNGYLCLGTERVPGNAALRDYIEALKWNNRNIALFGGDPNSVTVYGESAAGCNVEALMMSNAANDLFHRAIIESGSALADWSFNFQRLGQAKAHAINMGFPHADDLDRLGEFFENAPAEDLLFAGIALCIEREIDGIERLIRDNPVEILRSGNYYKVPVLFAYADIDAVIFGEDFLDRIDTMNNNFTELLPYDMIIPSEDVQEVSERLRSVYFGNIPVTSDSARGYVDFITDSMIYAGVVRSVIYHATNTEHPIYVMEFGHRGGFNQPNDVFPEIIGAGHADIVAHVMDLGHYNNETLAQDQIVRDRMTEMWTNFVKYGEPIPANSSLPARWLPFTLEEQHYLAMSSVMSPRQFPWRERTQLWVDLYDKYYYAPPRFEGSNSANVVRSYMFLLSIVLFAFCTR